MSNKSYLPKFLYISGKLTLATAIVFTAASKTTLAEAKVSSNISVLSNLVNEIQQDTSTSQDSSFDAKKGDRQLEQDFISSSIQPESSNFQNITLRERLKAKNTRSSLVSRLRSIRDNRDNITISQTTTSNVETRYIASPYQANNAKTPYTAYLNHADKAKTPYITSLNHVKNSETRSRSVPAGLYIASSLHEIGDGIGVNAGVSKTVTPDMTWAPITKNKNSSSFSPSPIPSNTLAQETPTPEIDKIINELRSVKDTEIQPFFYSPGLSIYVPTGFGGDRNRGFISTSYQPRGRFSNDDDLGLGIGVGLGDSRKSVGVELSYTLASFGRNRGFGSGGFNVKVHRQLPSDLGIAVGWNGFLNIGDENNFQQSLYGVATKIIKTQDSIDKPFSRVALTAGIGTGQFRTESAVFDNNYNVNVFGSVAVRVAKPASLIVEWTGQDLGVGVSVAPFPNLPLVITPAVRDITGAGDGARFVLGTGFSFQF